MLVEHFFTYLILKNKLQRTKLRYTKFTNLPKIKYYLDGTKTFLNLKIPRRFEFRYPLTKPHTYSSASNMALTAPLAHNPFPKIPITPFHGEALPSSSSFIGSPLTLSRSFSLCGSSIATLFILISSEPQIYKLLNEKYSSLFECFCGVLQETIHSRENSSWFSRRRFRGWRRQ